MGINNRKFIVVLECPDEPKRNSKQLVSCEVLLLMYPWMYSLVASCSEFHIEIRTDSTITKVDEVEQ